MRTLEERRPQINERMLNLLDGEPEDLYEASRHLVEAGGKRHRPVMTLLAASAVGGIEEAALNSAAAVELVHTFSLVQDDIFDSDELRRGVPSVHVEWGTDNAILASDLLFSKAFEALSRTDADPDRVVRGLERLSISCNRITEGQSMDMSTPKDEEEYVAMIDRKTAELHALATGLGGIVGGGTDDQVDALERYGRRAGLAFQIKDDVLDLTADADDLGKPRASDLLEGKRTLIVIHAQDAGDERTRGLIEETFETRDTDAAEDLIDALIDGGHIEYAEERAKTLLDEAVDALHELPPSDARDELERLADYTVNRNH